MSSVFQLRWYSAPNVPRKLQYRQTYKKNTSTVQYQTPFPQVPPVTQDWAWTDWIDVPEVKGD